MTLRNNRNMNKFTKAKFLFFNPLFFRDLVNLGFHDYLYETGWINSYINKSPLTKDNRPIPWLTYSFIDFIETRSDCFSSKDLFEYGAGNSTLYFSNYFKSVYSVEHDKSWYNKLSETAPNNSKIFYSQLDYNEVYSKFISKFNKSFDFIVVDGRDRVNCIKNSVGCLKDDGCLVLDDSERSSYQEGLIFLKDKGFKHIEFTGIAPGVKYKKSTTLFYKDSNFLNI